MHLESKYSVKKCTSITDTMSIKRLLLLLGETYLVLVIVTLVACLSFHMWTQFGIDNKGVPQFSLLDKIKLAYFYCISYKLGIIGKREWDHQYLYKLIQHDPVLTKLFRSFRHKYGKVAVSDIPFWKVLRSTRSNFCRTITET